MKKFLALLTLCLFCFRAIADPVDVQTAVKAGMKFMQTAAGKSSLSVKTIIPEYAEDLLCYYMITFNEGGWVMVSADNSIVPVLGYSPDWNYEPGDELPPAFTEWTNMYKHQIREALQQKQSSAVNTEKWNTLLNENMPEIPLKTNSRPGSSYVPGTYLLDVPERGGAPRWRQEVNNSGGCYPTYNVFVPEKYVEDLGCIHSSIDDCYCDHKPVGCGAIAIGEIMWKWEWPVNRTNATYDYTQMPVAIYNNTPVDQAEEIARFLRDCGFAAGMTYCCRGSYTTLEKLHTALLYFKYHAADMRTRDDWIGDESWKKLIRAEIDACRPVLYRGGAFIDSSNISNPKKWGSIHYFVCDGYSAIDDNYFHFNFGSGVHSFQYMNYLVNGSSNYTSNQMAIIGISPTCSAVQENILDVPYQSVHHYQNEYALHNISLPAANKTLTVQDGGHYILQAGNSIQLLPGFSVADGSYFNASIRQFDCSDDCGISVMGLPAYFSCTADGYQHLCYMVSNANTFEIQAYTQSGQLVYENAGFITGNPVKVWANDMNLAAGYYNCYVVFRNNCGEKLENNYSVLYSPAANMPDKKLQQSGETGTETLNITVYPNPSDGIVNISIFMPGEHSGVLNIYDLTGNILRNFQLNDESGSLQLDMNDFGNGIYYYRLFCEDDLIAADKIVVIK